MNPFQSAVPQVVIPQSQVHTTIQNEVIQNEIVEPIVSEVVNQVSSEVEESTETNGKFTNLINFHQTWGTDKIVSLVNGKVKKDDTNTLSFLNWLNTVKVDGNCLEKPEVLYVIREKLSADLGINSTYKAAESLWNVMNIAKWSTRLGVKSGYTRNKVVYEW